MSFDQIPVPAVLKAPVEQGAPGASPWPVTATGTVTANQGTAGAAAWPVDTELPPAVTITGGVAGMTSAPPVAAPGFCYDGGTTWRPETCNLSQSLLTLLARTATTASGSQTTPIHRGALIFIEVPALTAGASLEVFIEAQNGLSSTWFPVCRSGAITATGTYLMLLAAGAVAPNPAVASFLAIAGVPLPRTWRVNVVAANGNSVTYSVQAQLLR